MKTTNFIFTIFCYVVSLLSLHDKCVKAEAIEAIGIIKATDPIIANRNGCTYKGKFIPNGTTLQVTSCESCTCDRNRVFCARKDCARPPPGCSYVSTATECCNLICEKGCVYNGIFIPEGTTLKVEPCTYATCDRGKVSLAMAKCAPPREGCRYEPNMDECCNLVCDKGCVYNGIFIPEGTTSTVKPCTYATCNRGEVFIAMGNCEPPLERCRYESTIDECCNMICDEGCVYNGIFIPEGKTKTVAPCTYGSCDGGKVFIAIADCAPLPEGCRYDSTMEQCCRRVCNDPPILIKEAIVQ